MIPTSFDYFRPTSLAEAISLLGQEDTKILAGGHSLLPAMKLRLAQPKRVIDLGGLSDLAYIREENDRIVVGARTTHYQLESSALIRERCPLLAELAPQIGDVQVRNRGTIGGSLAHADPAGDWPAAILTLEAELELAGPNGGRTVAANEFFLDMMQTALQPDEILCAVRLPQTAKSVAYVKTAQKASGFAIAGVAVWLEIPNRKVRIGITGVAAKAYRAASVEKVLLRKSWTPELFARASAAAAADVTPLSDLHASAEYRAHLATVNTRRALTLAASRA